MAKVTSYEDLAAWQKSMDLVVRTYNETSKLPGDERFGLCDQMRRCAVRVPSTIAEGWARRSRRDYVRFLNIAQGSIYELLTQAEISHRLRFNGNWTELRAAAKEVARILNGLIRSLKNRD